VYKVSSKSEFLISRGFLVSEINKELEESEENILHNKYFVYPMGSVMLWVLGLWK